MTDIPLVGRSVILRDATATDLPHYLRWWREGEWRDYDAPWEQLELNRTDKEFANLFQRAFLAETVIPRKRLLVSLPDNHPIGWVIRYEEKRFPHSCYVGINICEDEHLNWGLGTEALALWVDYLFATTDFHRIAFACYSFNPRVHRLGEKLGFTLEGREREVIQWQGEWIDRMHFALLRREWEKRSP